MNFDDKLDQILDDYGSTYARQAAKYITREIDDEERDKRWHKADLKAKNAIKQLVSEDVIGDAPKLFINGKYIKPGETVTIDLENNQRESRKFIQENGAYMLWDKQRAALSITKEGGE